MTEMTMSAATLTPAPVLEALAAFEAVTQHAHDAGVEAACVKGLLKRRKEDIQGLERRLETSTHEPMMAALEEELAALREARTTSATCLQAIQVRRERLEQHAMELREAYGALAGRAKAAYHTWRKATRVVEAAASEASAYERYRARGEQTAAQQVLEGLVGPDEAHAVLSQGELRPWLKA